MNNESSLQLSELFTLLSSVNEALIFNLPRDLMKVYPVSASARMPAIDPTTVAASTTVMARSQFVRTSLYLVVSKPGVDRADQFPITSVPRHFPQYSSSPCRPPSLTTRDGAVQGPLPGRINTGTAPITFPSTTQNVGPGIPRERGQAGGLTLPLYQARGGQRFAQKTGGALALGSMRILGVSSRWYTAALDAHPIRPRPRTARVVARSVGNAVCASDPTRAIKGINS